MKIVSNLLENIEGIQIYYIIGLLIFFSLFVIIVIRTMRRPNKEMEEIKNSILQDNNSEKTVKSEL
ncbi:MAG: cbb3-type cytochrome c oxidase subunit 3 [Bacteroidetes bacterium]|nr:cbb3-type cytochrome c oxidase subunit 3 [Bacteroidota bacterium]